MNAPETTDALQRSLDEAEELLRARLGELAPLVVCLSGGVDSSLLAKLAHEVAPRSSWAITGVSSSLAAAEFDDILAFCSSHDVEHLAVRTDEMSVPAYVENSPDRCFHCKDELYGRIHHEVAERDLAGGEKVTLVDGTHAGDLDGHRPGHRAAEMRGVVSPYVELGLRKDVIRGLAARMGLENAARPSAPCLSSRIAYGVEVTPDRLDRVGQAEAALKALGFGQLRVRLHGEQGELARIEVPKRRLADVVERSAEVADAVKAAGFTYVTLDLEGLRSGSLLEVLK